MKISELKELFSRSFDANASTADIPGKLEKSGIYLDFSPGFSNRVLEKLYPAQVMIEREYVRTLNFVFSRIALTGVAAIILLLISIFLMEGTLSFNSFIGLSDTSDESILCLLTGN